MHMQPNPHYLVLSSLILTCTTSAQAPPATKGEWAPNGVGAVVLQPNGGLNSIPYSAHTITQWPWGTLPEHCYNAALSGHCNIYEVEAYSIHYEDCPSPTTMCRCPTAPLTIHHLARDFGRIPPQARQWIATLSAWPATTCSAASNADHIDLHGPCTNQVSVYFHEVAHSLDGPLLAGIGAPHAWSLGTEWADLVDADGCVADAYARVSYPESWAQVAVVAAYHANVADVWSLPGIACVRGQVEKVLVQLVETPVFRWVVNGTCERWWPREKVVCMGPEAEVVGACVGTTTRRDVRD